jgi:hypothetical protein
MHPTLYRIAFTIARYIVVERGQPNGRTYETPLPIHNQVEQPLPSLGGEREPASPLLSSRRGNTSSQRPQEQQER